MAATLSFLVTFSETQTGESCNAADEERQENYQIKLTVCLPLSESNQEWEEWKRHWETS